MSEPKPESVVVPSKKLLFKTKSWPPDTQRDAAWLMKKKDFHRIQRCRRCKSFTDSDLDDLRACFELGFGFGSDPTDLDPKLSDAFPALEFYCAVNKQYNYNSSLSRTSSSGSDSDTTSSSGSLFQPGDDPEVKKMRIKQWAKVVACIVQQSSST